MKIKKIVMGLFGGIFLLVSIAQAVPLDELQGNLEKLQVSMVALKNKLNDFSGSTDPGKGLAGLKVKLEYLASGKTAAEAQKKVKAEKESAAKKIQAAFRGSQAKKQAKEQLEKLKIEKAAAEEKVKAEKEAEKKAKAEKKAAATKIQALIRGYNARKNFKIKLEEKKNKDVQLKEGLLKRIQSTKFEISDSIKGSELSLKRSLLDQVKKKRIEEFREIINNLNQYNNDLKDKLSSPTLEYLEKIEQALNYAVEVFIFYNDFIDQALKAETLKIVYEIANSKFSNAPDSVKYYLFLTGYSTINIHKAADWIESIEYLDDEIILTKDLKMFQKSLKEETDLFEKIRRFLRSRVDSKVEARSENLKFVKAMRDFKVINLFDVLINIDNQDLANQFNQLVNLSYSKEKSRFTVREILDKSYMYLHRFLIEQSGGNVAAVNEIRKWYQAKKQLINSKAEVEVKQLEKMFNLDYREAPEDQKITLATLSKEYEKLQERVERALAMLKLYICEETIEDGVIKWTYPTIATIGLKIQKNAIETVDGTQGKYPTLVEILKKRKELLSKIQPTNRSEILKFKKIVTDLEEVSKNFLKKALEYDLDSIIQDGLKNWSIKLESIADPIKTTGALDVIKELGTSKDLIGAVIVAYEEIFADLKDCSIETQFNLIDQKKIVYFCTQVSEKLKKNINSFNERKKYIQDNDHPGIKLFNDSLEKAYSRSLLSILRKIIQVFSDKSTEFKKSADVQINKAIDEAVVAHQANLGTINSIDKAFEFLKIPQELASDDFRKKVDKKYKVLSATMSPSTAGITSSKDKALAHVNITQLGNAYEYLKKNYFKEKAAEDSTISAEDAFKLLGTIEDVSVLSLIATIKKFNTRYQQNQFGAAKNKAVYNLPQINEALAKEKKNLFEALGMILNRRIEAMESSVKVLTEDKAFDIFGTDQKKREDSSFAALGEFKILRTNCDNDLKAVFAVCDWPGDAKIGNKSNVYEKFRVMIDKAANYLYENFFKKV